MKPHKMPVCVIISLLGFFHICLISVYPGFMVWIQEIIGFTDTSPDAHITAGSPKIYGSLLLNHVSLIIEMGADGTADSLVALSGVVSLESLGTEAGDNTVIVSA
ncbi:MAG: hypothetical protein R6V15_17790 [Desulfotignum sp.]